MSFQSSGKYDVVICDIDGCLSPESHQPIGIERLSQVAQHNQLAIQAKDRPLVTLCSGRPISFVECLCRLLQNSVVPCIGENGAWLWRPAENSFEIDPAITTEHFEVIHETQKLVRSTFGPQGVVQQPGKSASVTLYHSDTNYLRSIAPLVEEEFQKRDWPLRVSMTWLYINCDLKHINKGTAIDRLMKETGLSSDRLVGIGDTMGDKTIADRVSWFGCPANAEPEIRKHATYVSEQAEVEGVLDILGQVGNFTLEQ